MKEKFLAFLSILPFFIVFTFFMIAPLIWIVFNAFYVEEDEIYSLANFIHIFESKFYLQSIINSLQISFISSIFGLLIGLLASYSLFILAPSKICNFLFSLNTMISNFSGVPLAFAFIIVLGSNGVVNVFLKNLGIEPFVSVYANFGVNIVYVYFQIPLAILLLLPAFKSFENSHLNACKMLGGGNFLYWLKIALPLLAPALFGVFVILFANAFGAYATIYALSSGNFNVAPVRIAALIAGDINLDPYMASALSIIITIIMLVVTFIANFLSKKYNFKVLLMNENLSLKAKIYHYAVLFLVFLFLALPLMATFLYSISTSWGVSVLPDDLTLKWYQELFHDERFLLALWHSLLVCVGSILLSVILVFPLVFVLNYYFLKLKAFVNILIIMPFAVPPIVSCVGLLQLCADNIGGTAWILIFTYFTIALPFIYRALDNAMSNVNLNELIASNAMLGGSLMGAIFKLVLPNLRNGILVAVFLSFSFLIGEFLYANILVGSAYETLQVYLYNIKNQSGHYSSALVIVYFVLIFITTFIASLIKE